jgi:flagellar motor switch protein FliG
MKEQEPCVMFCSTTNNMCDRKCGMEVIELNDLYFLAPQVHQEQKKVNSKSKKSKMNEEINSNQSDEPKNCVMVCNKSDNKCSRKCGFEKIDISSELFIKKIKHKVFVFEPVLV